MDGSSKDPGVQIFAAALNLQEKVANSTESIGDARLGLSQPVVVGDADVVDSLHEVCAGPGVKEVIESLGSGFLHALEAELHVDGHFNAAFLVGLQDVDPAQDGALVVASTTTIKPAIGLGQLK